LILTEQFVLFTHSQSTEILLKSIGQFLFSKRIRFQDKLNPILLPNK
jgi:hypothetical protein